MSKEHTYSTSQIAKIAGLHPNTVRMYEEWGLIQKPQRKKNGYRIFNDIHIKQFKLARKAFQIEVIQAGLRSRIVDAVKLSAEYRFDIVNIIMNCSVSTYIIRRRLKHVCLLLATTDESIIEIASASEFENVPYFNRAFKKQKGMIPGEYRNSANK